ncbi:MAG: hypothetical protein M1826_002944 [Phylliscum demangeonii]|nr:MAG: hypothetical protein M1826_002944 [Phylliscum demangeonii]
MRAIFTVVFTNLLVAVIAIPIGPSVPDPRKWDRYVGSPVFRPDVSLPKFDPPDLGFSAFDRALFESLPGLTIQQRGYLLSAARDIDVHMLREMAHTYLARPPTPEELKKLETEYWMEMGKKIERSQSKRVSGDALKTATKITDQILEAARAKFVESQRHVPIAGLNREWPVAELEAKGLTPPEPVTGSPPTNEALHPHLWRPYLRRGQSPPDFNPPDLGPRDPGPDFFNGLGVTANQANWQRDIVDRWDKLGQRPTDQEIAAYRERLEGERSITIRFQQEKNAREGLVAAAPPSQEQVKPREKSKAGEVKPSRGREDIQRAPVGGRIDVLGPPSAARTRILELQARLADLALLGCVVGHTTGQLQKEHEDARQRERRLKEEHEEAIRLETVTKEQYDAADRETKRCMQEAAEISSEIQRLLGPSQAQTQEQRTAAIAVPNDGPTNAGTDTRNDFSHHVVPPSTTARGPLDGVKTLWPNIMTRLGGLVRHNAAFAASAGKRLFSQHHSPAGVSRSLSELRPLTGFPEY